MNIQQLTIYSSQLHDQIEFYTSILGLKSISQSEKKASFQIGSSVLNIVSREQSTPYHFAINIPSNKEKEALSWLKQRVNILKDDDIELHDFDFWNAKAMYFYDADQNIVELIARKNLENGTEQPFEESHLLSISEIGLVSQNIEEKVKRLQALYNLPSFSGNYERMMAIGDDNGLFICINRNNKTWFPTGDKAFISDFMLTFSNNKKEYAMNYENGKIIDLADF